MEYLYLAYGAGISLGLDVVANFVRLEQEYEYAAGKVLQRAAQGHTDGHAGRGEECQERARFYTEYAYYGYNQYEVEYNLDKTENECGE